MMAIESTLPAVLVIQPFMLMVRMYCYTDTFGKSTTVLFQKDLKFTIKTKTATIMTYLIWNWLSWYSITANTLLTMVLEKVTKVREKTMLADSVVKEDL